MKNLSFLLSYKNFHPSSRISIDAFIKNLSSLGHTVVIKEEIIENFDFVLFDESLFREGLQTEVPEEKIVVVDLWGVSLKYLGHVLKSKSYGMFPDFKYCYPTSYSSEIITSVKEGHTEEGRKILGEIIEDLVEKQAVLESMLHKEKSKQSIVK